jgi:fructose-1,6-bisphosphatase/sedoheptulose 1,7-bisphosphatase-like protein
MARRFALPATVGTTGGVTAAFKSGAIMAGIATCRPKIYSFVLSTLGAAADGVLEWALRRFTVAGTSTAMTPRNIDNTDPSTSAAVCGTDATVEPTTVANSSLFDQGVNQRATYTWNAWTEGAQLVSPATAASGIYGSALSSVAPAYTGIAACHFFFEE